MFNWTELLNVASNIAAEVIDKAGKPAWEMMLTLTRIEGIQSLSSGVFLLLPALVTLVFFRARMYNWANTYKKETANFSMALVTISWALSVVMAFVSSFYLTSVWVWVAVFYPEAYIAKQVMDKLL